jgi:uncharacterized membrane protein
MSMLPPWPGWDGLHPLVIHFPVGLLLTAPVFVLLAILWPKRQSFGISALVLLILGTAAAFVSVETGEAAAELATRNEAVNAAIEAHAAMAETARNVFAGLTAIYAVVLGLPLVFKRLSTRGWVVGTHSVFLGLLLAGGLILAVAAHRGGILVHRLGVQAIMPLG